jgi:hypothetical protein
MATPAIDAHRSSASPTANRATRRRRRRRRRRPRIGGRARRGQPAARGVLSAGDGRRTQHASERQDHGAGAVPGCRRGQRVCGIRQPEGRCHGDLQSACSEQVRHVCELRAIGSHDDRRDGDPSPLLGWIQRDRGQATAVSDGVERDGGAAWHGIGGCGDAEARCGGTRLRGPVRVVVVEQVGRSVAMTSAPRAAASATSRPPVTPPAPFTKTTSSARSASASSMTCAAVRPGTGKAPATSHETPAGFLANPDAGAISRGAHVPWSRSGRGCVMTSSPGV